MNLASLVSSYAPALQQGVPPQPPLTGHQLRGGAVGPPTHRGGNFNHRGALRGGRGGGRGNNHHFNYPRPPIIANNTLITNNASTTFVMPVLNPDGTPNTTAQPHTISLAPTLPMPPMPYPMPIVNQQRFPPKPQHHQKGPQQQKGANAGGVSFFCDVCDKEFYNQGQYKSHLAAHVPCDHEGLVLSVLVCIGY